MVIYLKQPYELIDAPLWWHTQGLQQNATGYSQELNTGKIVRLSDGRTRRVYSTYFSNVASHWIILDKQKLHLR